MIKILNKLSTLILLTVFLILAFLIFVLNPEPQTLDVLGLFIVQESLGFIVVITFLLGLLSAFCLMLFSTLGLDVKRWNLQRKLKKVEKENS